MTGVKVIADHSVENASKAQGIGLTWSVVVGEVKSNKGQGG